MFYIEWQLHTRKRKDVPVYDVVEYLYGSDHRQIHAEVFYTGFTEASADKVAMTLLREARQCATKHFGMTERVADKVFKVTK